MDREHGIERLQNPVRRRYSLRQKSREKGAKIYSPGHQVAEPRQKVPPLDLQFRELPFEPPAVPIEHDPRERLIRVQHRIPFGKAPQRGLVVVRLGMNPVEEEPREWS